jgi:hypothetical protein
MTAGYGRLVIRADNPRALRELFENVADLKTFLATWPGILRMEGPGVLKTTEISHDFLDRVAEALRSFRPSGVLVIVESEKGSRDGGLSGDRPDVESPRSESDPDRERVDGTEISPEDRSPAPLAPGAPGGC